MNLKIKIFLAIFLATGIPLTIYGAVGAVYGKRQLSNFIYERLAGVNTLKREATEKVLTAAIQDVQQLEKQGNIQTAFRTKNAGPLNDFLTLFIAREGYDDVKLILTNGTILSVSDAEYKSQVGTKADATMKEAIAGATGVHFSSVFLDPLDDNEPEIYAATQVVDEDGLVLGSILIEVSLGQVFQDIASVTGLSDTGETYLAANDDYSALVLSPLKYDTTAALNRRINFDSQTTTGIQAAVQGKSGQGTITDYRGKESMAVWEPIPVTNWGIITKIDTAEGLEVLDRITKFMYIAFPTGVIFVGLLIFFLVEKFVSRPLREIERVTGQLASGQHHVAVDRSLVFSHDEFGKVATDLHHIQQQFDHEKGHTSDDGHQHQ